MQTWHRGYEEEKTPEMNSPKLKAPESYYYFIYQSQNIFKYVSLNIYSMWNWNL